MESKNIIRLALKGLIWGRTKCKEKKYFLNVGFKEALKKNNLKTYIWDICFIVSIIGVLFILFNGIRIII